jgi:hypothetical protein
MAKKDLKNRTQITTTLENDLYIELKKFSADNLIPISKFLDRAVRKEIDAYRKN